MFDPQHQDSSTGARFIEDFDGKHTYEPSVKDDQDGAPKRQGTLKKSNSVKRSGTQHTRAGSIHSVHEDPENRTSIFHTPVPTRSSPTEVLVNRFNEWRRILKDFVSYFKEVQVQYEARARGISKLTGTLNAHSVSAPKGFLPSGGILETNNVLRDFHKEAIINTEAAAKIESDVIKVLANLRNDLSGKIKEIKALSSDFKNNVDKEKEVTKKEIKRLEEAIAAMEGNQTGAKDPYLTRLALEKQIRRYLSEENYLHRAYLNIEHSGRELEKMVVAEIQKAYGTYVRVLNREGQELLDMADRLTATTLRLSLDHEWSYFVEKEPNLVNPDEYLREFQEIEYPGKLHPAVHEVRTGTMERKSKYLKSYTPGFYVLTPTHLHEFKSPDRSRDLTPVLTLPLADSQLGKAANPSAVSHKFVLKGRERGLHRGHSWVFRSATHDEMMGWYEALKKLTESSAAEREAFVEEATVHRRILLTASRKPDSYNSDPDLENDEADEVPYSGQPSVVGPVDEDQGTLQTPPPRPEGGRFPSDIQINNAYDYRKESISGDSDHSAVAAATAMPGTTYAGYNYGYDQSEEPSDERTEHDGGEHHKKHHFFGGSHQRHQEDNQAPYERRPLTPQPDEMHYIERSAEDNYVQQPLQPPMEPYHNHVDEQNYIGAGGIANRESHRVTTPSSWSYQGDEQYPLAASTSVLETSGTIGIIPFEEQRAEVPGGRDPLFSIQRPTVARDFEIEPTQQVPDPHDNPMAVEGNPPAKTPKVSAYTQYPIQDKGKEPVYDQPQRDGEVVTHTLEPVNAKEQDLPSPDVLAERHTLEPLKAGGDLEMGHPGVAAIPTAATDTMDTPTAENDPTVPRSFTRPEGGRKYSENGTISELKVPGQYPKNVV